MPQSFFISPQRQSTEPDRTGISSERLYKICISAKNMKEKLSIYFSPGSNYNPVGTAGS